VAGQMAYSTKLMGAVAAMATAPIKSTKVRLAPTSK